MTRIAAAIAAIAGRKAVVGRFPRLAERLPDALVIERAPGLDELSEEAGELALPHCAGVAITAATLVNHTLPRLLRATGRAVVVLVAVRPRHRRAVGPGRDRPGRACPHRRRGRRDARAEALHAAVHAAGVTPLTPRPARAAARPRSGPRAH